MMFETHAQKVAYQQIVYALCDLAQAFDVPVESLYIQAPPAIVRIIADAKKQKHVTKEDE